MNSIYKQYLSENEEIRPFFNYPLKPDWTAVSQQVLNQPQPFLLHELIEQNLDAPFAEQKKNLKLLQKMNALLVVTGQQLGLFVSPMYTIFKAMTTLTLCQMLNQLQNGFNYVPIFWLEGEDHDFAEVNYAFIFDQQNNLKKVEIESADDQRLPVSLRTLPPSIVDVLEGLKGWLNPTEFSQSLFEQLSQIYQPGRNWLTSFKMHLQEMLGPSGLLFFNPDEVRVKEKSLPFFLQIVEENNALLEALQEQSVKIKKPQVPVRGTRAYLFFLAEGKSRQPILRKTNGQFKIYGEETTLSPKQLKNLIRQNPERISSSVLTRPLWQSYILPVVSYVAGPAEIAYWAQLKLAFKRFKLTMPHLQPRYSATLIEPKIDRVLKKFDLQPEQVGIDFNQWTAELFRSRQLKELDELLKQTSEQLHTNQNKFVEIARQIDPTLASLIGKTFNNMDGNLKKMKARLEKAWRQKNETMMQQLQTIQQNFFPNGKPQERVVCPVYYFNKLGVHWLQTIFKAIDLQYLEHRFVKI
ncbi:MAG: bacillithiol biosynthesis cysteine-adding enzyme BshC [Caldisericaceae bacterium]|nr:bacillithiol biosynthesis cysteine-adding enzyme BshC [Caldisericaceae bacterium]